MRILPLPAGRARPMASAIISGGAASLGPGKGHPHRRSLLSILPEVARAGLRGDEPVWPRPRKA